MRLEHFKVEEIKVCGCTKKKAFSVMGCEVKDPNTEIKPKCVYWIVSQGKVHIGKKRRTQNP